MTITYNYTNLETSEENNYSILWSWYISNLDVGNFEELTKNVTLARKLDRFITNNCKHYDSVILLLLIPTSQINKTPGLISNVLNKFYDDGCDHKLDITPMGSINEIQSTVLMVKDEMSQPITNISKQNSQQLQNVPSSIDIDSFVSGELGYIPSELSIKDKLVNSDSYFADFSQSSTSFENSSSSQNSNLNSDLKDYSERNISSITGAPLSRTSTIEFGVSPIIQVDSTPDEQLDSSSLSSNEYELDSQSVSSSNTTVLKTFPTSVSVMTTLLNHSLILKSILFKSFQNGSKTTAIRQFGGGKMSDDWLLYDNDFSLNNLQLLDLEGVLETTQFASKILFYSLDSEELNDDYDDDYDDGVGDHDLTVTQFNGHDNEMIHSIRFVNSNATNATNATTPLVLSKTSTLKTNHESIKSEYLVHKVDASYSSIQKSRSTPVFGKKNKKRFSKIQSDKSCVIA